MNINATLILQSIAMLIFVWFCMQVVWPPILKALDERRKRIAGGSGTRFWPLSRHRKPKQLLALLFLNTWHRQMASRSCDMVAPSDSRQVTP